MIGFGLLEVILVVDILVNVDLNDVDGDGILGWVNVVWLVEYDMFMLGCFGFKVGSFLIRE